MRAIFIFLMHVFAVVGTGVLAWNTIEPSSFLGAVGFIVLWGLMETLAGWLLFFLSAALYGQFSND